jgi:hypothetical protein
MDLCNKNYKSLAFMYCFYIPSAFTSVMSFSHPNIPRNDGSISENVPFIQTEKLIGRLWRAPKDLPWQVGVAIAPLNCKTLLETSMYAGVLQKVWRVLSSCWGYSYQLVLVLVWKVNFWQSCLIDCNCCPYLSLNLILLLSFLCHVNFTFPPNKPIRMGC